MTDITNTASVVGNHKPHQKVVKKIGLITMISICIGLVVVQGAMISSIQGIALGGSAFIAAAIIALIIAHFNIMSFSELSLMFPAEGTLATYTQKAIGHFPAIVSVYSGYFIVAILALPVELFLVDAMLDTLFPGMLPAKVIPLLIVVCLCVTNIRGTDVFAKVQNLIVAVMVSAILLVGLTATFHLSTPPEIIGTSVDFGLTGIMDGSFIGLIALAMWLFVGAEFICPMINEVQDPNKNIPISMHVSVTIMAVMYMIFAYGAAQFLSIETILESGIPYVEYAVAVFGKSGLIIATVMALAATFSTANTILAALPRMLQGMAEQKQTFPILKRVNRFGAPWVGILMMASFICIIFLAFELDSVIVLVIAATLSYLLAYIIAHIDVMVLRRRMPNHPRPYRTPFYPIPQILGIVAMIYVIINSSPAPEMTAQIFQISGGMLLVISVIAALWVKLYMKKGLFEPDDTTETDQQ